MPIALQDEIRVDDLRGHPEQLFVFGLTMASGRSGSADEMAAEPNAVGIPTKWASHQGEDAFFVDRDLARLKTAIDVAIARLRNHLLDGGTVVFPRTGVGSGMAERAPKIAHYIKGQLAALKPLVRASARPQAPADDGDKNDVAGPGDHRCSFPGCPRRGIVGRHIMRDGPLHREIETEFWDCQVHARLAPPIDLNAMAALPGRDAKQCRLL